jgi:hypothetical protein
MEKRNLILIFCTVLVLFGIVFNITNIYDNETHVTGFANPDIGGGDPDSTCPCEGQGGSEIQKYDCDTNNRPFYCDWDHDLEECFLVKNCVECGCEGDFVCNEDAGTCNEPDEERPVNPGSTNGDTGDDVCQDNSDCNYPNKVCIFGDNETSGSCETSSCGDGVCAYELESEGCAVCLSDCLGLQADCTNTEICQQNPSNLVLGICLPLEDVLECEDGTSVGSCSNVNYGSLCQITNGVAELIESCQSCDTPYLKCPGEYTCMLDGSCELNDTTTDTRLNETSEEECEGEECDGVILKTVENYCEYVGGKCSKECDSSSYELVGAEYSDLIEDCKSIGDSLTCCYPSSNDEVNDCEYYGGSCLNSCEGNYYSSETPYLDDECDFYKRNTVCCLEYKIEENGAETTIGKGSSTQEGNLLDILFSPDNSVGFSREDVRFGEYISLNRGIVTLGFVVLVVIVYVVFTLLHFKPKVKVRRKKGGK